MAMASVSGHQLNVKAGTHFTGKASYTDTLGHKHKIKNVLKQLQGIAESIAGGTYHELVSSDLVLQKDLAALKAVQHILKAKAGKAKASTYSHLIPVKIALKQISDAINTRLESPEEFKKGKYQNEEEALALIATELRNIQALTAPEQRRELNIETYGSVLRFDPQEYCKFRTASEFQPDCAITYTKGNVIVIDISPEVLTEAKLTELGLSISQVDLSIAHTSERFRLWQQLNAIKQEYETQDRTVPTSFQRAIEHVQPGYAKASSEALKDPQHTFAQRVQLVREGNKSSVTMVPPTLFEAIKTKPELLVLVNADTENHPVSQDIADRYDKEQVPVQFWTTTMVPDDKLEALNAVAAAEKAAAKQERDGLSKEQMQGRTFDHNEAQQSYVSLSVQNDMTRKMAAANGLEIEEVQETRAIPTEASIKFWNKHYGQLVKAIRAIKPGAYNEPQGDLGDCLTKFGEYLNLLETVEVTVVRTRQDRGTAHCSLQAGGRDYGYPKPLGGIPQGTSDTSVVGKQSTEDGTKLQFLKIDRTVPKGITPEGNYEFENRPAAPGGVANSGGLGSKTAQAELFEEAINHRLKLTEEQVNTLYELCFPEGLDNTKGAKEEVLVKAGVLTLHIQRGKAPQVVFTQPEEDHLTSEAENPLSNAKELMDRLTELHAEFTDTKLEDMLPSDETHDTTKEALIRAMAKLRDHDRYVNVFQGGSYTNAFDDRRGSVPTKADTFYVTLDGDEFAALLACNVIQAGTDASGAKFLSLEELVQQYSQVGPWTAHPLMVDLPVITDMVESGEIEVSELAKTEQQAMLDLFKLCGCEIPEHRNFKALRDLAETRSQTSA